jgi:hypothetical protein
VPVQIVAAGDADARRAALAGALEQVAMPSTMTVPLAPSCVGWLVRTCACVVLTQCRVPLSGLLARRSRVDADCVRRVCVVRVGAGT